MVGLNKIDHNSTTYIHNRNNVSINKNAMDFVAIHLHHWQIPFSMSVDWMEIISKHPAQGLSAMLCVMGIWMYGQNQLLDKKIANFNVFYVTNFLTIPNALL